MSRNIIHFPGHKWFKCRPGCDGCQFCHGGLGACVRCGGLEGSLPTDCPGTLMPFMVSEAVYEGKIDFRRRDGWIHETSRHAPPHGRRA